MAVITISRQYAAGGSTIARLAAERLGWPLIDNEFVKRVAERVGLRPEEVEEHQERVPGLGERLAQALAISSPEVFVVTGEQPDTRFDTEEELVRATEAVINEAVQERKLILVGRGAQAYLAEHTETLHVYIVAPRDVRIEAAAKELGISREEAEERVNRIDKGRRDYVKTYYQRRWDDPTNYHLVINTSVFTYEQAAEMIVGAVEVRGWR